MRTLAQLCSAVSWFLSTAAIFAPRDKNSSTNAAVRDAASGLTSWEAVGKGALDYAGQFRALLRDGYCGVLWALLNSGEFSINH